MSGWKRCLLMSVLAAATACGDDTAGGVESESDGSAATEGDGSINVKDGGVDGGRNLDGSTRRDGSTNNNNNSGDSGSDEQCGALKARVRDFNPVTHPDFEKFAGMGATTGLVKLDLGADRKPIFNEARGMITSAASFDSWYNDTTGINLGIDIDIPLTEMAGASGSFEFNDSSFFPIDKKGFTTEPNPIEMALQGADGQLHNFNFTTEVHTKFTYRRGDNFMFQGDDDLWIFVNGKLALDLGGLHGPVGGNIDFDAKAAELGITVGETYNMDIFHAERHTSESNFRIRTNIECFKPVIVVI